MFASAIGWMDSTSWLQTAYASVCTLSDLTTAMHGGECVTHCASRVWKHVKTYSTGMHVKTFSTLYTDLVARVINNHLQSPPPPAPNEPCSYGQFTRQSLVHSTPPCSLLPLPVIQSACQQRPSGALHHDHELVRSASQALQASFRRRKEEAVVARRRHCSAILPDGSAGANAYPVTCPSTRRSLDL